MRGDAAFHVGWRALLIGAGMSLGIAGCAGEPAPEAELAAAEVAVENAEDANAAAQAPGPYELARDKMERAREAFDDGDNMEARRLAEQAQVDAQLAEAEARSEVARQNATDLRTAVETLQDEIARATPRTS
jgi:hypothetical protein